MLQVYHNNALLKFLNDIRLTLLSFKSRLYLIGLLFHLLYFSPFLVAMRFEPRISQYFDRVLPTPWPYLLLFVIKRNCFTNNDVVVCKYSMALNLCTTVSRESFQGLSFQWVKSLQMHLHTYLHLCFKNVCTSYLYLHYQDCRRYIPAYIRVTRNVGTTHQPTFLFLNMQALHTYLHS